MEEEDLKKAGIIIQYLRELTGKELKTVTLRDSTQPPAPVIFKYEKCNDGSEIVEFEKTKKYTKVNKGYLENAN